MKHTQLFYMVILFIMFIISACSNSTGLPEVKADATILAFGDSLTFGTGAEESQSYPAVLASITGIKVVNAGIPGETTGEGLKRLPRILDDVKPTIMILCLGGNDFLRKTGEKQAAENLRSMLALAKERSVPVLLVAVPSFGLSLSPPKFYRELASEFNIPLEEKALSEILMTPSLKADQIHPNGAGYRKFAEAIHEKLKKSGAVSK